MTNLAKEDHISLTKSNEYQLANETTKSYLVVKRVLDIFGAIFGLLLFSIVFILIAILIKAEDPKGSVFFKQIRIGEKGREFYIYKFRSMSLDAETKLADLLDLNEVEGAMFKMKDDPRITKVGKFIRKTSIDELPQLFNVLKGEMSLVGPRPPLPREVEEYTNYDKQRLFVKPGCTGLWQISGRSNTTFKEMVELDLEYISKRSIILDILIIFKTIFVLLGSKNAY
jgi:exopolysaccharide biosynthesis polyprenyl glycosylphosphotransferase